MLGKATFELYHRTNYPSCPAVTLPLPTYAGDATEFDKMYQCMDTYVKMSPDLTPGASCQIFNNFIKCMGNNVTEKEAEWGKILAGPAFTLTVEMMERVCDVRMNDDDMEIIEKFDAYSRSRGNTMLNLGSSMANYQLCKKSTYLDLVLPLITDLLVSSCSFNHQNYLHLSFHLFECCSNYLNLQWTD